MYYMLNTYISTKMWTSALTKANLWSTNDGKASWSINGRQTHQQGVMELSCGGNSKVFFTADLSLLPTTFTSPLKCTVCWKTWRSDC